MFYLAFFDKDVSSAVISDEMIIYPPLQYNEKKKKREREIKINDQVVVQWGEEQFFAKIIQISPYETLLNQMIVDHTGSIIDEKKKPGKDNVKLAKKRLVDEKKKNTEIIKKQVSGQFDDYLLRTSSNMSNDFKKKMTGGNAKSLINNGRKNLKTPSPPPPPTIPDIIEENEENIVTHINSDVENMENEQPGNSASCTLCAGLNVSVTAELLTVYDLIGAHLKLIYKNQSCPQSNNKNVGENLTEQTKKLHSYQIPKPGWDRLMQGYDCFINSVVLNSYTIDYKNNVPELTRKLLTAILGEETLAQSSVGGTGKRPPIDPEVRQAVKAYVLSTVPKENQPSQNNWFTTVINRMCSSRAYKLGLSTSKCGDETAAVCKGKKKTYEKKR